MIQTLKNLFLSERVHLVKILRGPFRGARLYLCLRDNLRKIFGLYEHELNPWLENVLPRVEVVLDVGANDGYFTLGCAAAFRRLKQPAHILAFEPQAVCCDQLRQSIELQQTEGVKIEVEQTLVGNRLSSGQVTLDVVARRPDSGIRPQRALIKIDVEGAEVEVIDGASEWLSPTNYFLIEVHHERYLKQLQTRFATLELALERRDQKPLLWLGPESRAQQTWWLVSALS